MAHRVIDIPGGGTRFEDKPSIAFTGGGNEPVTVRVTYRAGYSQDKPLRIGELTFTSVLEFRFIEHMAEYEQYENHEGDGVLGLVEVLDSEYVKTMLRSAPAASGPNGNRFAETIPNDSIHHYRVLFDEYGKLDVIALNVEVR